tara:strand:- start:5549 stop:5818 length:270 start_codon:yes stop_codon:yes gene_type:complete
MELGVIIMGWENILKGLEQYSFYLSQIEKVEKLLERLYEDIEEAAIKMNKETGLVMEQARSLITTIQKPTISKIEETLEEFKEKLEASI